VNAYVSDANRRLNWNARDHDPRPGQLGEIDVHLRHRRARQADADRVPIGVAGIGLYCELVIVYGCGVVAHVNERRMAMMWAAGLRLLGRLLNTRAQSLARRDGSTGWPRL
jgi:hypothetical protein